MPLVSIAAAAALAAGGFGLANAWRRRQVEDVLVASTLVVLAAVGLAGTLSDHAGAWTIVVAATLGAATSSPLVGSGSDASRLAARHWRWWTVTWVLIGVSTAVALPFLPILTTPSASVELALVAIVLLCASTFTGVAWRMVRRYRLGHQAGPLITAIGLGAVVAATAIGILAPAAALIGLLAGVLVASLGLALTTRADSGVATRLAPLVRRDPLLAVELQLTPVVQRYVAALDRKDPLTRDHGLRVGELAMRVGTRAQLSPERLQALGLAALLHDVGKLFTPDRILFSSTTLTPAEFDAVREHPVWGAELMASSPLLAPAADLVRWHHERVDGAGYPDRLRGSQIPLEAAIISVCDAWDAMTFSLRYRSAMSPERARWVLLGGSGTQWSPRAVELLLEDLAAHGPVDHAVYDAVPRTADDEDVDDDAIPDEAKRQLT